ncbi:MAG TPA: hypothetical protein VGK74_18085 [Symbiobacteriaceae bacterium]|jgi:hypothetical protein
MNAVELDFGYVNDTWALEVVGGKDVWGFLGAVGSGGALLGAAGGVIGGGIGLFTGPGFVAVAGTGAAAGAIIGGIVGAVAYIRS